MQSRIILHKPQPQITQVQGISCKARSDLQLAMAASCISLLVLVALATAASAQLSPTFYDTSCPRAAATIKAAVAAALRTEPRMGASLVRLHFHDCFVQGCDASVLLAGQEQDAPPNKDSLRGYGVIDNIKTQVEAICKQTVSCADILTLAARDSVVALGGPSWTVSTGQKGLLNANVAQANTDLPGPTSSLKDLVDGFMKKNNLNLVDMVALSGAHTLGQSQCGNFKARIYGGDANINAAYAASLKANCPQTGGDKNLAPLDPTPNSFDNAYFVNLLSQKGLLHSDQVLFNNGTADNTVRNFASNAAAFSSAFASAMIKMGNIEPKTGTQGQIRLSCSKVNS